MIELIRNIPNRKIINLKCSLGYTENHQNLILATPKADIISPVELVIG
jgi:hypothetical protein